MVNELPERRIAGALRGVRLPGVVDGALRPVPVAPGQNPFDALPFPSPGERIKAEDFGRLSQALRIIADAYALSAALFGRPFGDAKLALISQQYEIERAMSVFGAEVDLGSEALDNRKVIQVVPLVLGQRRVAVVVTEAVETNRVMPDLRGLTYREAAERLRLVLGETPQPGAPVAAAPLVGLSLDEARRLFGG